MDHRQRDYVENLLNNLSFEELQIVEAFSNNQYLKRSAALMLKSNINEMGPTKKYLL